jgi:hypothetical protein
MKRTALLFCTALALTACSSSTSPSSNNNSSTGQKPPSSASKGNTVDFTGTYGLSTMSVDSSDGGSATYTTDANDGATLTLTSAAYTLTSTGNFAQNLTSTNGTYVATDTSASAQRGTLVLNDSSAAKTQNAFYSYAGTTLSISIPNGDGNGNTVVTAWIKQ